MPLTVWSPPCRPSGIINEKEIEQRNASTTEEVLQYTQGVFTDYYGTDDRNDYFKIRGFQATTYRDGLMLGSMRGVREEPYAFERVEVLRGANSTLFGPEVPGVSVNFVSKRPRFERFGEGYLSYGSFDAKEAGVDVGDTLNADETAAYRFTGTIRDSDREYDHSNDNNGFLMGGLTWEPTAYTFASIIFGYLKRDDTLTAAVIHSIRSMTAASPLVCWASTVMMSSEPASPGNSPMISIMG